MEREKEHRDSSVNIFVSQSSLLSWLMKNSTGVMVRSMGVFYLASVLIPTALLKLEFVPRSVFANANAMLWGTFYITIALFTLVVFLSHLIGLDELRMIRGENDLFRICEWVYSDASSPNKRRLLAVGICIAYIATGIMFSCGIGFGTFAISLLGNK